MTGIYNLAAESSKFSRLLPFPCRSGGASSRSLSAWQGEVEVFDLVNHPKAKRCYAWSYPERGKDQDEKFVAVLEVPPVVSAVTAAQASIVADAKKGSIR